MTKFIDELDRAVDKLQDRLLHEGESRPRPVYFVVRFLVSPWGSISVKEHLNSKFSDFFGVTEVSAIEIDSSLNNGASNAEWNNLSLLGIGNDELWMLLKVDPVAFLESNSHGRDGEDVGDLDRLIGTESSLIRQVNSLASAILSSFLSFYL